MQHAEAVVELLKLLRSVELDRTEIRTQTGYAKTTVWRVCSQLESNGLLVSRLGNRGDVGRTPRVFTVARAWRGAHE